MYVVFDDRIEEPFMGADCFFEGEGVDFGCGQEFVNNMACVSYPFEFLLRWLSVSFFIKESWFLRVPIYRRDLRPSRATRRRAADSQVERKWRRTLRRAVRGGGRGVSNVSGSTE